jgi:hypothetical protein
MHILLIEDMSGFALPIKACLEAMGHSVTWVIGVAKLRKNQVVGILASANAEPLMDSWDGETSRLLTVKLRGVDLALVDGGLAGPIKNGWDIVPTLVANGIVCVGISGAGGGNPSLKKSGAKLNVPKEFVILALRHAALNPSEAVAKSARASRQLTAFSERLRSITQRRLARKRRVDLGFPILNSLERSA